MMDRRMVGVLGAVILLVVLAVLAVRVMSGPDEPRPVATSLGEAVGSETEGYRRAEPGTPIRFPEDHGPHPDYQLEWWYLTANLRTEDGRRFGVQFTIFRNALRPPDSTARGTKAPAIFAPGMDAPPNALISDSISTVETSNWSTRQLYLAHAAVTDIRAGEFLSAERLSRGAAGLAFARINPLEVRVENWFLKSRSERVFPLQIRAATDDFAFDLEVTPVKPVVLQGDAGFSPKGPAEGQASMYYSYTRLRTTGSIRVGDEEARVEGLAWMDREWSTSFLGEDQTGWDWFSIQLDDGRDLMVFQLRGSGPESTPWKDGMLVEADGSTTRLAPDDFILEAGRTWTSPVTGARYPVEWRLQIPEKEFDLILRSVRDAQELNVSVNYWEGAIDVLAASGGEAVGSGYLEMTGYADGGGLPGMD